MLLLFRPGQVVEKVSVKFSGDEIGLGENALVERDGGLDPLDDDPVERAVHSRNGFRAIAPMSYKLRHQRIVVGRHNGIGLHGGIHANPRSTGNAERRDAPR